MERKKWNEDCGMIWLIKWLRRYEWLVLGLWKAWWLKDLKKKKKTIKENKIKIGWKKPSKLKVIAFKMKLMNI